MDFNAFSNIEAEKSVLGAALQSDKCAKLVADLSPELFYEAKHRTIHAAIVSLVQSNTAVDLITMDAELGKDPNAPQDGGIAYLMALVQFTPTIANIKSYIQILVQCAARRKLRDIGTQIAERAGKIEEDVDETREWAAIAVREIHANNTDKVISMQESVVNLYDELEDMQRKENEPEHAKRIRSGISSLDAKLGGITGSKLVVIGARPSVGKSILALTFCVTAAKQGKKVLLVTLEMNDKEITQRVFANEAGVPMSEFSSGNLSEKSWVDMAGQIGKVSNLPLWYCTEATTVERIRRVAFSLYENGGLDMIAVDYLQLMEATYAKKQNRQEQVSEISRGLRRLSQELNIPVLALTQLNRQSEGNSMGGKKVKRAPTMSEARESGAIEQDANIFMLLHDPDYDEMRTEEDQNIWKALKAKGYTMMRIIIDKNRQGKKGITNVAFDGDHMRFLSIACRQPT